jgi:hypothetical protein
MTFPISVNPTTGVQTSPIRAITVAGTADPAAGAEMTVFTVPAGQAWELLSVRFTLVSSATVATRRVHLTFDDGTNTFAKIPVLSTQAASLTYGYTFMVDIESSALQSLDVPTRIPRLTLPTGFRVITVTENIQAGDNFSAGVYAYVGY